MNSKAFFLTIVAYGQLALNLGNLYRQSDQPSLVLMKLDHKLDQRKL